MKAAPDYVVDVWDRSPRSCAVGAGERTRSVPPIQLAPFTNTWLFPQPQKWSAAQAKAFEIGVQPRQSWRYNSLDAVAKALCPEYGMAAFVAIRELPSLLGLPLQTMGMYTPGRYNVAVACPVGALLTAVRGYAAGDQVCIISEGSHTYGVVTTGQPKIRFVSKSKITVVAPVLVDYNINSDYNIRIHFKRSVLDHYDFCQKL